MIKYIMASLRAKVYWHDYMSDEIIAATLSCFG